MTTQADVENLLQQVPLASAADESHATDMLQTFVNIRNAAFEGAGLSIPGTTTAFSIPAIIQQLRSENWPDAAVTLMGIAGDAAGAYSFLVSAGIEAGAFSGVGALSSSAVVTGMLGEAAGPLGIAASVLVATARIPIDATTNLRKLYFLTDASGILTSWMFNLPEINPHARLIRQAHSGGFAHTDISGTCRLAQERVHDLWRRSYQGNSDACRAARASAGDSWERFWRQIGAALDQRMEPRPTGVGPAWVDHQINEANRRLRQAARETERRAAVAAQRRAAGGYWFRTADGLDLFMPDA